MIKYKFKENLLTGITNDFSNEEIILELFGRLFTGNIRVHKIGANYLLTLGKDHYLIRIKGDSLKERCRNIIETMEPVYKVHI